VIITALGKDIFCKNTYYRCSTPVFPECLRSSCFMQKLKIFRKHIISKKSLDRLSRVSVDKMMVQKTKSGKYCTNTNASLGYITPLLHMAITRQEIKLESCSYAL